MKKILVIKSHTREDSFCNVLTNKYIEGLEKNGKDVKILELRNLSLEQFLKCKHKEKLELPENLKNSQKLILWADHLVFSYPLWWATSPALLRLFIEIVFVPEFAYKFKKTNSIFPKWDKLLTGKTARIIVTMDSPPFYVKWILGDPGSKLMKILMNFTGIKFLGKNYFGSVATSTKEKRIKWLDDAYKIGISE